RIAANALWTQTAKLPEIEIAMPDTILAKDTVTSMQAGLVFGCIGQTEYIVKKMLSESGIQNCKVVATGGLGKIIADATDIIEVYDPTLTLKGLKIISNKNKSR
ncbi:MAG TPA: type III pantothenate kinase, partial [Mobilitalea sp.]|nr:type III pantothenate kinase [Mobilitalea sp.]